MRERDRRTFTVAWVGVTVVAAAILIVVGSPLSALALVAVAGLGLIGFLRTTHPRGHSKPNLGIFFDDLDIDPPAPAPTAPARPRPAGEPRPARPTPPARERPAEPEVVGHADVIDLRQSVRRDAAGGITVQDAVAVSNEAGRAREEVADELAAHHVRLLRQVQVKLQDYE